jgi:outer membrane protein TolC
VAEALAQNPVLQAARAEVPGAQARVEQARSGGRFSASTTTFLTTGSMFNNLAGPDPVGPQDILTVPNAPQADQNVMLMYPLSTGGRVQAQVAGAGADLRATQADADTTRLDTAYLVRRDYWQVLFNQEAVKIAQENLQEQEERLRVDQVTTDAGKLPPYYVLRDQAEVADARQGLTNARRDVDTALLQLRQDLGLPMEQLLTLTDALVYDSTAPGAAAALSAEALKTRPEALAAQARVEAAQREVEARRSAYRPQVAATAMSDAFATRGQSAQVGYTVGVTASLPLADGGSRSAEVAEAQAAVTKAQADLRAVNLDLTRQVHTALVNLAAAEENVSTAEQALAAAEEDYRVALVRYQAGKAINLEPISALAALVRARTNHAQAVFDQRVALDAVQRAAGRLPA